LRKVHTSAGVYAKYSKYRPYGWTFWQNIHFQLADAKKLGYRTCLFYIGTELLSINIAQVQARVLKGRP
jgi:hypothetical protein